jgi:hypothetical protein
MELESRKVKTDREGEGVRGKRIERRGKISCEINLIWSFKSEPYNLI